MGRLIFLSLSILKCSSGRQRALRQMLATEMEAEWFHLASPLPTGRPSCPTPRRPDVGAKWTRWRVLRQWPNTKYLAYVRSASLGQNPPPTPPPRGEAVL